MSKNKPLERLDNSGRNWTKRNIQYEIECRKNEAQKINTTQAPNGEHIDRSFESPMQDWAETSEDF